MLSFLKQSNKNLYDLSIKLIIITIIASMFVFYRVIHLDSLSYIFLIWNIFLAWLPFYFSLIYTNRKFKLKYCQYIFGLLWLVFYPNAPYMLTDFIHLSNYKFCETKAFGKVFISNFNIWYDFFLISIFVIIGLVLSFVSLSVMHKYIKEKYNHVLGLIFIFTISMLSGFAIYLGRFIRLNSWEFATNPTRLINVVFSNFNLQALRFTLLFGSLTLIFYVTFFLMNKYHSQNS